jgi:NAD(P)H-dependent FMN reductase
MKLLVVIASTRPGRIGATIADWFVGRAGEHGGFDIDVADLAELDLPLFDEPEHPASGRYVHAHTKRWSAQVAAADAVVFVMPEYNHSFNGALKNAIDYLNREWAYKPVAFVSYGGVSGGLRAVQALKPVVTQLRMVPVADGVTVPMAATMIDSAGFHPTEVVESSAKATLDELHRLAGPLAAVRTAA